MHIHYISEQNSILNHFLAQIRDVTIQKDSMRFRKNIERIGEIMAYELSKTLEYKDIDFDYVITVCDHAKEVCPYFPSNAEKFHHNFPDPSKLKGTEQEIHAEFVRVREMIKSYCSEFVKSHS